MAEVNVVNGAIQIRDYTDYPGPYSVNPTLSDQTLNTQYTKIANDITVSEIPSNYASAYKDGDTLFLL